MIEKEHIQSLFVVSKLMTSSHKLNEIINNTKSFGDKREIGYKEEVFTSDGVVPKFIKSTTQESKLKSIIAILTCNLVATS